MAIINLGQFGRPRESVLAGAARATEKLPEVALRNRELALSEELARGEGTNNLKREKLDAELARDKFAKQKRNEDNTLKALEQWSMKLNSFKEEADRKMYLESSTTVEIGKLVKKYLPQYWDKEKGIPIALSSESIFKEKIASQKARLGDKILGGAKLTEDEKQWVDFVNKSGDEKIARAVALAQDDLSFRMATQAEKAELVKEKLELLGIRIEGKAGGNAFTGGLSGEDVSAEERFNQLMGSGMSKEDAFRIMQREGF